MAYPFELPPLKFAFNALEPAIDAKTMEIHHDRHHGGYVNNLNAALKEQSQLQKYEVQWLLRNINSVPEGIRMAVRNNGGGHANHSLFWEVLTPGGSKRPASALDKMIADTFGSFDAFVEKFSQAATTRFGSGWAWLALDATGNLLVYSTANQDSPYMDGYTPILGLDVWEHAYYLTYQNRRADYIKAFWSLVNWDAVTNRFKTAT